MPLNLARIKVVAESFQVDTCEVTRDTEREADDIWDPELGEYVRPTNDFGNIYTGQCMIYPNSTANRKIGEFGEKNILDYCLEVPIENFGFQPKDLVLCTASAHDPRIVGQVFIIDSEGLDTFGVVRLLYMHLREAVER